MSDSAVLLIDSDTVRAGQLQTILAFIDDTEVIQAEPDGWHQQIAQQPVKAVILEQALSERATEVAHTLHDKKVVAPVLLLGEPQEELPETVLGVIEYPLAFNQLLNACHRIEAYHNTRQHSLTAGAEELSRVLVGRSTTISKVRQLIGQVADSDANVLILGESGTGKEVVAKSLHYLSSRRQNPFVPVNCGAIPGDLLESELFGHEKGAFTGALTARQGRFEIAEGGTLFLDEIGDMPMPMQVKLLRVLQERTYERVGSNKSLSADVRVIAATHRDLEDRISDGEFREDLFYRLNVFPIEVPALRERPEDVSSLVHELIARLERDGRESVRLTAAALNSLSRYPWPGNVRELANLIERLVIMHPGGIVDVGDLPAKYQSEGVETDSSIPLPEPVEAPAAEQPAAGPTSSLPSEGVDLKDYLSELERDLIQQALEAADGVVAQAAKLLNLRRTTLVEKMRKYDLQRSD